MYTLCLVNNMAFNFSREWDVRWISLCKCQYTIRMFQNTFHWIIIVEALIQCQQHKSSMHHTTFETYQRQTRIRKHNWFMGGFRWHGVITFIQSWWVTSCILSGLGQPDGYSAIMKIMTTSSNRAVGIFTGYGHVKTYPSTMLVRWHFMAHWLCLITQLEQAGYEEKLRHMKKSVTQMARLFPITNMLEPVT